MCSNKTNICSLVLILAVYAYGVITVQYKVFPYKVIRAAKQFVANDINISAKTITNKKILSKKALYQLGRKSFIEENLRDVEIVMLGDSITDYANWAELFPSKEITNQGIGGDTTIDILSRIQLIKNAKPEKVFIMVGINDLFANNSVDEIKMRYEKIVNELIANNIRVYIQSTLLVERKKHTTNNRVKELNTVLEKFSHTNELITYIDLNDTLSDGEYLREKYSYDSLHLNGKGYRVWRDIIKQYIM